MDWLDFTLKFSSELLVLVLAIMVAFCNLYFFHPITKVQYSDNSQAAKLLANHVDLNPKLYAKNTTIITTVEGLNSFFPQAQADDFASLTAGVSTQDVTDNSDTILNDGAIVKINPDSISSLIAKQVKIYETKPGDTLKSIAADNGIKEQTILWANNLLNNTTIRPGWQLIILPTDGILYTATSNDTIPDLATKFGVSVDTIVSYNGLDNAEDIDAGQLFIIPGGKMPEPVQPKPTTTKPVPKDGGTTYVPVPEVDNGTGHIFPRGYCTWYVASMVNVPWGGNAKNWLANARAYGASTGNVPMAGAIVVTNESKRFGHVALVKVVDGNRFLVSEMNYSAFGKVDERWINTNSSVIKGFIYK